MNYCPRLHHTRTPRKMKKRLVKNGVLWLLDRFAQGRYDMMNRRHAEFMEEFVLSGRIFLRDADASSVILDDMSLAE